MESNHHIHLTKEEIELANENSQNRDDGDDSDRGNPSDPVSSPDVRMKINLGKEEIKLNKELLNDQIDRIIDDLKDDPDTLNIAPEDIKIDNQQIPEGALQEENNQEQIPQQEEKDEENKADQDQEEEEEEEEKFENAVEAKDFHYFKSQCKFERFVTQLGSTSNRSKEQGALFSYFGNSLIGQNYEIEEEEEKEDADKPMIGFDTRFTYNREGLIVYDINSNILLDS